MRLDFNLQLQQEQKLIMTQELQLAVKMLQLTSFELNQYIDEQLMENPLLEIEEKNDEEFDKLENFIDSIEYESPDYMEREDENEYVSPFNFIAREASLWDYLKDQLRLIPLNKRMKFVGEYIIDNINENGYLTVDNEDISKKCCVEEEKAEEMVEIIQSFDPPGICGRNLKECLLLQLERKGIYNETIENIINNMLEEVGEGRISKIADLNNISFDEAEKYLEIIKCLDPKPGIRLSSEATNYIIPDVFIEKINDEYVVSVNEESIPHLKVSNAYKKVLKDKNTPEYRYVKEKLQAGLWLLKSIEQRMQTIKKVVTAILKYQIDYFDKDMDLKPLTLKQIAEETNLHESTVSRAVKGKYVQSPKGIFEIKNFFIKGMQTESGEDISTLKIKNRIREIVNSEDKKKPYSDQQISEILVNEGINISRRTVAKYREEINIASSSKRKKK